MWNNNRGCKNQSFFKFFYHKCQVLIFHSVLWVQRYTWALLEQSDTAVTETHPGVPTPDEDVYI